MIGRTLIVYVDIEVVPDLVAVHKGIAHKVLVADNVDPFGRASATFKVVTVIIAPQLIGYGVEVHAEDIAHAGGEDPPPAAVGVELHDGAALGMVGYGFSAIADHLETFFHSAQVAG